MVANDTLSKRQIQRRPASERPTLPDIRRPSPQTVSTIGETLPPHDNYKPVVSTVATLPESGLERGPTAHWRDQRDEALKNLNFFTRAMMTEIPAFRDSAVNALLRFTREHIEIEEPYTEYIFDAAQWLLRHSYDTGHIGNRSMAGRILAHVGPYLPEATPEIYEAAQLLRVAAIEQHNDAIPMITAYRQLVHCLQPDHVEVSEGVATFSGLAITGRSTDICRVARETRNALRELKSGLPDSGNTSAPLNGGPAGGSAHESSVGGLASGLATSGLTYMKVRPV